jgi:hypothetical protein
MTTVYTGYTSCFLCGPCCSSTIFVGFWVGFFSSCLVCSMLSVSPDGQSWLFQYSLVLL